MPTNQYTALWSRLVGFDPEDFSRRFEAREFVRISLHRSTIHTVTARDCLRLRPMLEPVHQRPFRSALGKRLAGVELAAVVAEARALVEQEPRTFQALGRELTRRWPEHGIHDLAMVGRQLLPLVQVPPRGLWQRGGAAGHTTAQSWLGAELGEETAPDELVLRYLAAFGPASVKDAQSWSGLTRLREVFARLASRLREFRAPDGRVLYDLADAAVPDEDTPAPARFLPEFDNLFIGHHDRTRVISDEVRSRTFVGNRAYPVFLADGFIRGTWRIEKDRRGASATLALTALEPLSAGQRAELEREGAELLAFHTPDARHELRWTTD